MSQDTEEAKNAFEYTFHPENDHSQKNTGSYEKNEHMSELKANSDIKEDLQTHGSVKSNSNESNLAIIHFNGNKNPCNDKLPMNPNNPDITDSKDSEENTYWKFLVGTGKFLQNIVECIVRCTRSLFCGRNFGTPGTPNYEKNSNSEVGSIKHQETAENPNIKTLEHSITYFKLSEEFTILEASLKAVRRKEKSIKDHDNCFKDIDKKILNLSILHHPDKVKGRGGTESEIETAKNLQAALNAMRTALNFLNSEFIEDIGTDHHFGFYTKLNNSSMCNEDQIKKHISEVIFKIDMISQIKQQYIVPEICKFLIKSKTCIGSYLDDSEFSEFETTRDASLCHLKYCIQGFQKLCMKIQEVKEQCESEENAENILSVLQRMLSENDRHLKQLQSLEKAAKSILKGTGIFFNPGEPMDSYFVLPLVSYTNVILMCNAMVRRPSIFNKVAFFTEKHPQFSDELSYLMDLYYFASYCSGNKHHKKTVLEIMYKTEPTQRDLEQLTSNEKIKQFQQLVKDVSESMECKFNVNKYPEISTINCDLKKCLIMMAEFQEKEKEISRKFKEIEKKAKKINEEHEKYNKTIEESEELNQKLKESIKESEKLNEIIKTFFSEQL